MSCRLPESKSNARGARQAGMLLRAPREREREKEIAVIAGALPREVFGPLYTSTHYLTILYLPTVALVMRLYT